MNLTLFSGNDRAAAELLTSATRLLRFVAICAMLVFGGFAAQAAPLLTLPGSVTVGEDTDTDVSFGVSDNAVAIFTVVTTASSSNTNLVSNASLTSSGFGTNRLLSIKPGLHKYGTATITVVARDSTPASTTNTFGLTVTFTNYPPIFLKSIGDLTRNENAPSTNLSFTISDIETPASNLIVTATSTNTSLVPNNNLILSGTGTNRTLTLTQATNQNGTTLIEIVVTDGGGATATNDFILTVWAVNQPPTFTLGTNRLIYDENFGAVTDSNFITGVSSGPTNQSSETNFFVLKYTTNFFAQAPAVDTNGALTFQVGTNLFGTNTITFVLYNNGSTTNGGKNSLTNSLTLDVPFVNQAPSFAQSASAVLINEETLAVTNIGFLTNITTGPSNQSSETWTFALSTATNNATNAAFTVLPAIATNGTLTFHPAAHSYGTNLVTVVMTTSGTTNNGGVNKCSNSFVIEVAQTNHAPVIVVATNFIVLENGSTNLTATVNVWDYDTQSSNLLLAATSLNTNLAGISITGTNVASATNAVFTLAFAPVTNANGPVTMQLIASEGPLSTTNTFKLTLTPVNQGPSFTLSASAVLINEETLAVTNVGFLTNITTGPSNQSSETWTFALSTATNNATNAAFTVLPTIATNGTLTFHPAAHSYGTNVVTVVMTTSGTTNNGGINKCSNSFVIEVAQTNHAPVIVVATNFIVLENGSTNLTATVNVWDYDTQSSNLLLAATSLNTNLAGISVTGTNVASATNAVFTLTFAPVTNANGPVTMQLIASEGPLSTTNTFKLTLTPVNQGPSFTLSASAVLINEETLAVTNVGFLTNITTGPSNQSSETWTFALSTATNNATNAAFTVLPAIATNGTLTFHPAAHSYGTNLVTVVMTTSGTTNNGGINKCSNSFVIEVAQTNHAPVIVVATNFIVLENGTTNLTATVNVWDYDTQSSNLLLAATSLNTNLAGISITGTNVASATNAVFTLTFAPVTNANGPVTMQLIASEGPLSTTNTFKLTLTPVNQGPSFTLSASAVLINEETLAVTNVGFLTNITTGPSNQSSETWTFALSTATNNATNAAFTVLPAIATNGTLTFHPAAHSYGTNVVTVVMTTSGTTNNGGINKASNSFVIEVAQTNHAPVIVVATNFIVLENGTTNLTATVNVWDYDTQSSNLVLAATSLNTNLAGISITGTNMASATNAVFTLTFAPVTNANGPVTMQLIASEGPLSTTNTFKLTLTPVNQGPSFTLSTSAVLINEETLAVTNVGFLTNITTGPSNQSSETWTFALSTATNNATNAAFTVLPAIATNGTLTFHPAAHSYGTNVVTVLMTTSGTTNNGGVNTCSNSFVIEVAQTNHAPVIVVATNFIVLENGTTNLTATVNVWDYDTQSSNLLLAATSLNTNLAGISVTGTNVASATNAVFTLTFAPVTNANGPVTMQLIASEGPLSTTNTFKLTLTPVNQGPSFTLSTSALLINEETLAVTNIGFLTNITTGPSNQSSETWTFALSTATNNATNAAFTVLPAIATNGTLTFHPAAHSYGTNVVTVVMTTSGTTNNGGINKASNSFVIEVAQTNHAPVIVVATNFIVLENGSTNLTATVNVWDYDTQSSNLLLAATSLNTNLAGLSITGTNVASATNAVFTLTFAPVTNANGPVTMQLIASEGPLSTTNTFKLTITPINQAPSYTLSTNLVVVAENAGQTNTSNFLTGITTGPSNQSSETWTFNVFCPTNNATNATFARFPTVSTNGNLVFMTATNSFGTNVVSVVMTTSGTTNNGGINTYSNSFQLEVTQVQYPPTFTGITNKTILENATTNLTLPFTLYDPLTTNFTVTCVSSNTNLVAVTVGGIGNARTLIFAPVTNMNGSTTVSVTADDGSLTNSTNLTVTIVPVNQAPSFNLAVTAITVDQYDVPISITNAVTNILAGPTNESTQTVSFTVTNSSPGSFLFPPSVNNSGTLTFTPGAQGGTVRVGIKAVDDGGTSNGGVNTSPVQILTITIPPNAFQYLAGPFAGLFYDTNTPANASSGYVSLVLASNGTFSGQLLCAGDSNTFTGQFSISNSSASVTASNYNLNLVIDTSASWTESVSGSVSNVTSTWNAELLSYLVGYSASFPTPLAGDYLIAMPGLDDPTVGPTGDSVFSLLISNNGVASLSGYMADNTYGSQVSQLSLYAYYPLYLPLYSNGIAGSLIGWLNFTGALSNSISPSSTLTWYNENGASTLYPGGFTNQAVPLAALYDSTLSDLLSFSIGTVILNGGNLVTPITNIVAISDNIVTVDPSATNGLSLTIDRATGEVSGSFIGPGDTTNSIDSVIIQNSTNVVRGYFLGTNQAGSFILFAD